jgi:hypothetical protein
MFLDGDMAALAAYHSGDRTNTLVRAYYGRFGLSLKMALVVPV